MSTAGGFIHPSSLLSPPASSAASSVASSLLPTPRSRPLVSGSAKETGFINYVDRGVQQITRRYAMKHGNEEGEGGSSDLGGYGTFKEAGADIEKLLDVVWVCGTPTLQVPYLLSLALLVVTYIPSFPPAPRTMFRVLGKLDYAFASLIQGKDIDSGAHLPGCDRGSGISGTAKVRMKSIIERTRVIVVEAMAGGEWEHERSQEDTDAETDIDDSEGIDMDEELQDFDLDVARVYDRTIVELGDTLGGPAIGIPGG